MYYDMLLTSLFFILLLTEPGLYLKPVLVAVAILPDKTALSQGYQPRVDCVPGQSSALLEVGHQNLCVRNSMTLTLIALLAISDLLLPALEIEISLSAPILKHLPIPLPITYSSSYHGTPWPTFCIL